MFHLPSEVEWRDGGLRQPRVLFIAADLNIGQFQERDFTTFLQGAL